jgi:hypothetical protein
LGTFEVSYCTPSTHLEPKGNSKRYGQWFLLLANTVGKAGHLLFFGDEDLPILAVYHDRLSREIPVQPLGL